MTPGEFYAPSGEPLETGAAAATPGDGGGPPSHHWVSAEELRALREKLREAQETLEAIQSGEVDAVVVTGKSGSQIYTLTGAEEPYRVYVEQMQEGAVTVSPAGVILYCNRKFAEFLEIELEQVIGSDALVHLGEDLWREIARGLGGGVVKSETLIERANGSSLPVMITASTLAMVDQKVICLVVTDLSERKERFDLNAAKEIAESANRSKDAFIAALSHELRTPLTPALMGACLLERDTSLSDKARGLVTMIRRNVEVETRLIDDLLDLTRITQGKIELCLKPLDLHGVVHEAIKVCQGEIEDRGQTIAFTAHATNSRVMGDAVRLQQIFWNLLRNASKFSGPSQTIEIVSRDAGDGRIEVSIHDRGVGIDQDTLAKLFSPFEQGGDEVTRRYGGLGLGLVISKSIADMHEGASIQALSDGKGQGSTFVVSLRTLERDLPNKEARDPSLVGRILLVEDNPDTRMALSMLLETLGYEVHAGESVQRGLEIADRFDFDLLISDVGLPDGTGYDLMRQLEKRFGRPGIAISGYGMPEDIQRSMEAGFQMHLIKPVRAVDLEASLAKLHQR